QIIPRNGTDLVHLADQEIVKRLLGCQCSLLRGLMNALMRLRRCLLVQALKGWLRYGLGCWLNRHGCRRLWCIVEPPLLELMQLRYHIKFSPEVLERHFMLGPHLRHELRELNLVGTDLLFNQAGTVLQITANITHCLPS